MTKEEIQTFIEGIYFLTDYVDEDRRSFAFKKIFELQEKLESSKSIKDLEEEAFEAGAESWGIEDTHGSYENYTFEEYLKSKENESK